VLVDRILGAEEGTEGSPRDEGSGSKRARRAREGTEPEGDKEKAA